MDCKILMKASAEGRIPPGTVHAGVNVKGEINVYAPSRETRHVSEPRVGISRKELVITSLAPPAPSQKVRLLCAKGQAATD